MAASGAAKVGTRLVFFGAPGVGKGTYASRIAPLLNIPTISTGDIVRAEIAAESDVGKQVKVRASRLHAQQLTPLAARGVNWDTQIERNSNKTILQELNDKGQLVPDEIVTTMVR